MNKIELPTLLFWENGNSWYGSLGEGRFFLKPQAPEGEDPQLFLQFWRGPLTLELSEILATARFPISEEGLDQATAWLEQQVQELTRTTP